MLISQSYIEQNRQLHASRKDYGVGSLKYASKALALMKELECKTMLEYGCGKGTLLKAIPGARGYDPAIPEYAERPVPADLVVCTDVLEHIEPECLEEVLEDLRVLGTKGAMLFISCRPASKFLPDGRNAHLIVESQDWWLEKLSSYFEEYVWRAETDGLFYIGTPLQEKRSPVKPKTPAFSEFGTPNFCKRHGLFVPTDVALDHIESSCKRNLPDLKIGETREDRAVLCAFGPSLNDSIDKLRTEENVTTVSGAHDVLLRNGIVPSLHIEGDAHKHKAQFMSLARTGIKYYLASRCHPDCFDLVLSKAWDVNIWHMFHYGEENELVKKYYPNAELVRGTGSIASRAFCVLMVLGFRKFRIYAMDCSFPWDESKSFDEQIQHASKHPNPQDVYLTDPVDGKRFYTTQQLWTTCNEFLLMLRRAVICDVEIMGKGFLAHKAKSLNIPRIRTPDL